MTKSNYKIIKKFASDGHNAVLILEDLYDSDNPTMSVTNDIDRIFEKELGDVLHLRPSIIYKNTEGCWDLVQWSNAINAPVWNAVDRPTFDEAWAKYIG